MIFSPGIPLEYTLKELLNACRSSKMSLSDEDRQWLTSEVGGERPCAFPELAAPRTDLHPPDGG